MNYPVEGFLGLIFQASGLAFFVLGVAALMALRQPAPARLSAHMGWLAAFGMTHGLMKFVQNESLDNPSAWLPALVSMLILISLVSLLEFGRRLWNDHGPGKPLNAVWLYPVAALVTFGLIMSGVGVLNGLELGARYLAGAPGAFLAGLGLIRHVRALAESHETGALNRWLRLGAVTMFLLAVVTLFPTLDSANAAGLSGLAVELARTLCGILLALSSVFLVKERAGLASLTLRRVTDNLHGFVYRCLNDSDWKTTYITEGVENLTGYPSEDFLAGKVYFGRLIHPDDRQKVWDDIQFALAGRRDFQSTYRVVDRAGHVRWCYEEGRGIYGGVDGELLYLEGYVRDDGPRRQAEHARLQLHSIVEVSPQPVGWADPDGKIRYFNQAMRRLLSVPDGADVTGYCLSDFYGVREYQQIESEVLPAVMARGEWSGQIDIRALDDRIIPVLHNVFGLRDEDGGIVALANMLTDVSQIRSAERDLHIKDAAIASWNSAIVLTDLAGKLTYVNQAFVSLWKLSGPDQALGKSMMQFWQDQDRAQSVRDAIAQHGDWRGELRASLADGSVADIELAAHMVRDREGIPICVMGSFIDISERRAAQSRAEMLQRISDDSPQPIGWATIDGKVRYFNKAFRKSMAVPEHARDSDFHVSDFYPEQTYEILEQQYMRQAVERGQWVGEMEITALDGRVIPSIHSIFCLRDDQEEMVALAVVITDLSELKDAQAALAETEFRYRQLFELSNEGIVYVDADSMNFVIGNPGFADMIGYAQEDIPRLRVTDIHPPESLSWVLEQFKAIVEQRLTIATDIPVLRRDGSVFYADITACGIPLEGRSLLAGIFRDVSERRNESLRIQDLNDELEARVRQRTVQLERANAAKNEFLSRMSHELRTPLNAIIGFAQLLQLSGPGAEPLSRRQNESVTEIHQASQYLLELVNDLLDLARVEAGHLHINSEPVALIPLIENAMAQVEAMAQKHQVSVTLDRASPVTVMADPTRVLQVLLNLLTNAIKYNQSNGSVEIKYQPKINKSVQIAVRDTGRGLSADQQARLFRPFERLESAYEGIEGSGIGLALSKRLVEGLGGVIGVDSALGRGSTFWFELPLCEDAQAGPDPAPISSEASGIANGTTERKPRYRILYIEDNLSNQRLARKILALRPNIELQVAESAELGLDLANEQSPDLILLDLNLPGMDGFEALARLRENPLMRKIPVIAVTANAMANDIERGKMAGFDDYVTKPLDIDQFLKTLESYVSAEGAE